MNRNYITALAFFLTIFATADAGVVELTESNFASQTSSGNWFIKFYVQWCPHCQNLKPIWDEFASSTQTTNVGAVDCDAQRSLCRAYNVSGYPTLYFQKDGKLFNYNGERSVKAFEDFVESGYTSAVVQDIPVIASNQRNLGTSASFLGLQAGGSGGEVIILADGNFTQLTNNGGDWIIMFYAPWCPHCKRFKPTWSDFASVSRGKVNVAMVDCVAETKVCGKYQISGYPTVYFLKNGKKYAFRGDRTVAALESFVNNGYQNQQGTPIPTANSNEGNRVTASADFSPRGIAVGSLGTLAAIVLSVLLL